MSTSRNKRDIAWGILLLAFGLTALLNFVPSMPVWGRIALMGGAGLIGLAVFLTDREDWVLLIPAYIMLAAAGILSLVTFNLLRGEILATTILGLVGLPFFLVFFFNMRQNWWALIPAWVLTSIAGLILLTGLGILVESLIPLYVLFSIGLPFLVVYLINRQNWWALVPAYVMFSIGLMVYLITINVLVDLAIPAYVMFAVALPFLFVYFTSKHNRWAIIPGGIMAVIGLGFLGGTDISRYAIPAALILVGAYVLFRSFRPRG